MENLSYPVILNLRNKDCLVVGGGMIALKKVRGLLNAGARVTVIAITTVGPLDILEKSNRLLTIYRRPFQNGDTKGYSLVLTATGVSAVDKIIFTECNASLIWINSADDKDTSSFILPAIVKKGDITVAISTGGKSPKMATWLRDQIDNIISPQILNATDLLAAARQELKMHSVKTESVDWNLLLNGRFFELINNNLVEEAEEELSNWISSQTILHSKPK